MSTPIALDLRRYSPETQCHSHDYHQLVLPLSGRLELDVAGHGAMVDRRTAAVIEAGRDHAFAGGEDNHFVVADLPVAMEPALGRLPAFIELDPGLRSYVHFIAMELRHGHLGEASRERILGLLLQLLRERYGAALNLDKRLLAARDFLDAHLGDTITLDQVASAANLSRRHLSDLFKNAFGMTPMDYLRDKRMRLALALLENSQLSIQRIALDTGFQNQAAFSDRFRRHFGKSPKHFRPREKN
ncbi:helix-turn-helix domain-containing protein [Hahella sp. KA22]|uniref:helix-turn-helix transcriptional regulator n=1 Tax=Hahella sp. KA22 TaxID=1628392 RepID=UPI000FDE28F7|nr:AraC family transcriptional regulator [Hahella sp. KA22]AZZ93511.1 AraC family transcriptional regulator [Hahella sp. KA22]QAY56886.1 helix-turn-helix domain-containing protein [Hahella sp. KA22]